MVATVLGAERRVRTRVGELTMRIQSEYDEMPGLCLTPRQARRLWNIEADVCARVLNLLIEEGFLRRTVDGRYVRARH
jgi:hypothetical protein